MPPKKKDPIESEDETSEDDDPKGDDSGNGSADEDEARIKSLLTELDQDEAPPPEDLPVVKVEVLFQLI